MLIAADFSEAINGIENLRIAMGEQTLRATGYAGARIFQIQAILNAAKSRKTGILINNIIIKRPEEKCDGGNYQTYIVTVRTGKKNVEGDAYYWRWVEDGHKIVGRKAKFVSWKQHREAAQAEYGTKRVPPHPYMRPAYYDRQEAAIKAMEEKLKEKIQQHTAGNK